MAWPAKTLSLPSLFSELNNRLYGAKTSAQGYVNTMATESVDYNTLYQIIDFVQNTIGVLTSAQAVPGMVAYAREQFDDAGLDVAGEATAIKAALQAIIDEIVASLPVVNSGGTDYHAVLSWGVNGDRTLRAFTPAMTASVRTNLNSFIALIG